jgi:hypothetical protein
VSSSVDARALLFKPDNLMEDDDDDDDEEDRIREVSGDMPEFVRRILLRANPSAGPAELRELNYAERRMALFLIFSAISKDPPGKSFATRLRSLAVKHGPEMYLIRMIVSFL